MGACPEMEDSLRVASTCIAQLQAASCRTPQAPVMLCAPPPLHTSTAMSPDARGRTWRSGCTAPLASSEQHPEL
eukprot:2319519-Alexandrium_andersonii.AAC.1